MKQPLQSRLIIQDARRKNLSAVALLDPSPKQITIRKASIGGLKNKENMNSNDTQRKQKSSQNTNTEDIRKQISQLIKKTAQSQRTKLKKIDIGCQEQIEINDQKEGIFDEITLRLLYQKELEYKIHPQFFEHQSHISPLMRSILYDWISEVCKEFTLKRETFHLCIHNLDRYMSKISISKSELQLCGLASLLIACKIEEIYPPKVNDFSSASNYGFTEQQILDKEQDILSELKWMINPPTLYLWSSWYLSQWDIYYPQTNLQMKQPTQSSYTLFRHFMTFLDCAILDIKLYQFTNREIVSSLLYLVLLKQYCGCTYQRIVENKIQEKDILDFQRIYKPFIEIVFGFQFTQLSKCIRYLTKYLILDIVVDQPGTTKVVAEKELVEVYEYFLSIQTHNPAGLQFIRK
ncbi:unnamed protein product [Paramecium primaurelia]|uniref:Cyclin-like domain-containing protein n=1 Tax=Paramecium primaurelia TaxID=5886 RepID=A0A8S1KXS3_PARPR|nr:unnamed protein product [Paramecium primaurelia]